MPTETPPELAAGSVPDADPVAETSAVAPAIESFAIAPLTKADVQVTTEVRTSGMPARNPAVVSAIEPFEILPNLVKLSQPKNIESPFTNELIAMRPNVMVFARSLCSNTAQAEDLVQQTFIKALAHEGSFVMGTNLRAWLFTIALHEHYSRYRKLKREVSDSDGLIAATVGVQGSQDGHMEFLDLQEAMKLLPKNQRKAINLIAIDGYTYEQAAEISGCTVGTIKSRVNRTRIRLARILGEDRFLLPKSRDDIENKEMHEAEWRKCAGNVFERIQEIKNKSDREFTEGMPALVQKFWPDMKKGANKPRARYVEAANALLSRINIVKNYPVMYQELKSILPEITP